MLEGCGHKPRDTWRPRSWKGRKDPALEPQEGAWPCDVLITGSRLRNWERMHLRRFSCPACGRLSQQPQEPPHVTHLTSVPQLPWLRDGSAEGPASRLVARMR